MSSVSARAGRNMYVLMLKPRGLNAVFWLTTLATNRHDSWRAGEHWVRDLDSDRRRQLKREGYRCVKVRIEVVEEI